MNLEPIQNIFPKKYLGKWCIARQTGTHAPFDQMYIETIQGCLTIRLFNSHEEGLSYLEKELKPRGPHLSVMQIKQIDPEKKSVYPELPCIFLGI